MIFVVQKSQIIEARKGEYKIHVADEKEYWLALVAKIKEEAEVRNFTKLTF